MAATAPTTAEVRTLFRALLREAKNFQDYNIREYIKRRTKQGFQEYKFVNPEVAAAAFSEGRELLNVARRQASVYSLYAPRIKNIMEVMSTDS